MFLLTVAASKLFDLNRSQDQLQTFYNSMSKVQISPWNPDDTVHIVEVYTNLSWVRDHRTPSGTRQMKLKDYGEVFQDTSRFPNPKRILIHGRPGIGKTTFSQKIAFDWANGRKEILKKFSVLLMIRLRDVCGLEDFGAVLKASKLLANDESVTVDNLHNYVLQNQDKVLLVLDGYDEYHEGRSSPIDQIWQRVLLRDCYAIMTTRLTTEVDKMRKSSDAQLEIRGFDTEQQVVQFASKYLSDEKEVKELTDYLRKENIWDVAEIPLLLLMMCLVWRDRHHRGLPKSELELYERFVETLLYHMSVKDSVKCLERNILEIYKEELTKIGKLALDALLQGTLYFPLNQIHTQSKTLSDTMIRSGLFQISKLSTASPEKTVFFLHKSIQEFLAAWFIMHEAGLKEGNADGLSSIDSLSKVSKVKEILLFMCHWSEEGAKAVFSLLQLVGEKERLTEYDFAEVPIINDLSEDQRKFCTTCLDFFQSCPVLHRQAVSPLFLNSVHGVVVVGRGQGLDISGKKVLKFSNSLKPDFVLFEDSLLDPDHLALFIMRDLEAVVLTCYGETKPLCASMFCSLRDNAVCLKREGQQMILYFVLFYDSMLWNVKLLTELTSASQTSQSPQRFVNRMLSVLTRRTPPQVQKHSLSFVRKIIFGRRFIGLTNNNLPILNTLLPLIKGAQLKSISFSSYRKAEHSLLTRCCSWVSSCYTDNLCELALRNLNLKATCARSLHGAPNLQVLDLSGNNFCSGVRDLAKSLKHLVNLRVLLLSRNPLGHRLIHLAEHLYRIPHLTQLDLSDSQMGEDDVSAIARNLHNVSRLEVLNLHSNQLGHGICELCRHLHSVPCLTMLNLCDTKMGKEEVTAVASALKDVPELKKLDLSDNRLGHGMKELNRHLSSVSKLTDLYLARVHMTKKEASDLCRAVRGKEVNLHRDHPCKFCFHSHECSIYSLSIRQLEALLIIESL